MPSTFDIEAGSLRARTSSAETVRWLFWTAWAVVLLGVYYKQLWRALASPAVDWSTAISEARQVAVLGAIVITLSAAALPAGMAIERLLGWPRLPPRPAAIRRVVSGTLAILIALGPLAAYVAIAVQAAAGSFLPYAGEASARALSGIFGMLVVMAAALPAGQVACALLGWRAVSWREELLYYAGVGLGIVAAACGLLALAGIFRPRAIQAVVALLVLVGLPRLWAMARRAGCWTPEAPDAGRLSPRSGRPQGPPLRHLLVRGRAAAFRASLQAITGSALFVGAIAALAPEVEYDALWYHLGLPKLWLEAGRPVDLLHEYVSLYPLTWELVFAAGLVIGGPVAAKLLHFVCLPLAALLVWELSRRLAPRAEPWLAVALFVTAPTVLWEATTTYVDLALALQIGLGLLALLRYVDGGGRGWFGLAVVTLGIAMAIKHLALVAVAILAPGLALWRWRREQRPFVHALRPAVLLVVLALIIPLPWYLRSWLASGNPVFPELFGLFGGNPPERWDHLAEQGLAGFKARFGTPRTLPNLLALPWDMTVHAARFRGSLGPLFLLLLPALALFRNPGAGLAWVAGFAGLFVAVWASPISSFQLRFLVVIAPVLAVLAAEAGRRLFDAAPRRASGLPGAAFVVLLGLNLPPFTHFHERDRVAWDGWLTHVIHAPPLDVVFGRESQHEYLSRLIPTYGAWQFVNRSTAPDARVLTYRGGDHYYSERWRISHVAPMARAAAWQQPGDEAAALRGLRALGVTHILVDRQSLPSASAESPLMSERMRTGFLALAYEDHGALVFEVVGGRQPSASGQVDPSQE